MGPEGLPVTWGRPPHLTAETTVAEACVALLEGRTGDAVVHDADGRIVGMVTAADLARVPEGARATRVTLGELLHARRVNSLGPYGGSPCDHRPYEPGDAGGRLGP